MPASHLQWSLASSRGSRPGCALWPTRQLQWLDLTGSPSLISLSDLRAGLRVYVFVFPTTNSHSHRTMQLRRSMTSRIRISALSSPSKAGSRTRPTPTHRASSSGSPNGVSAEAWC